MAHYDSFCPFCGDVGQFFDISCCCADARKARAEAKAKFDAEYKEAQVYLDSVGYPASIYVSDEWRQRDLVKVANWLKGLLPKPAPETDTTDYWRI